MREFWDAEVKVFFMLLIIMLLGMMLFGCATWGQKGMELGDVGFIPLKEAQIANARDMILNSTGAIAVAIVAIAAFIMAVRIVKAVKK